MEPLKPQLIDFGVSQMLTEAEEYWNSPIHQQTYSISSTIGLSLHPSDDIEALIYSLYWLAHNSLPWQDDSDMNEIIKKKWDFLLSGEPEALLP